MIKVQRIERHVINRNHIMWSACDELCFQSKNVFNYANYILRQQFIQDKTVIKYNDLTFKLKTTDCFKELGSNSAQHTLKLLCKSWKSFLVSVKDYYKNPSKYFAKPKLPRYKDKNGRHICIMTNMQTHLYYGYLYFAFTRMKPYNNLIRTNVTDKLLQTRIVPKGGNYILEIVYEKEIEEPVQESKNIASIDLGVNNFVTIANNIDAKSIIINGRGIKSYNVYWNKQMAKYKSLAKKENKLDWTKRQQRLTNKRNNKMEYFMHKASKEVIRYCLDLGIDTLVIGLNKEWKQEAKLVKSANQTFVQISYDNFISKLTYKCKDVGIKIITHEESYTSGTSFLDAENPCKEFYNKSRRIVRGLFKSNNGTLINSDLNGAYQIMKKVFPNAFANGILGADLHPVVINL